MKYLVTLLLCASSLHAQTVIRSEITHINGVKLAQPIVTFDATATKQPPLIQYQERLSIRGETAVLQLQTQRPFVQMQFNSGCPGGVCPVPQRRGLFR